MSFNSGDYNSQRAAFELFRYVVASCVARNLPVIWSIDNTVPVESSARHKILDLDGRSETTVNDIFIRGRQREVTLPPKYSHHKARRLYIPVENEHSPFMSFEDGSRLLLRRTPSSILPKYVYYIFDFGLRARGKRGARIG
ncbi:hypothetical protein BDW62DRAFT_178287 [Aspergillus aurantiobrunneus]